VGDDVVELASDDRALVLDGDPRPLRLLALKPVGALLELAHPVPAATGYESPASHTMPKIHDRGDELADEELGRGRVDRRIREVRRPSGTPATGRGPTSDVRRGVSAATVNSAMTAARLPKFSDAP
jgi:hypothetical protein